MTSTSSPIRLANSNGLEDGAEKVVEVEIHSRRSRTVRKGSLGEGSMSEWNKGGTLRNLTENLDL